MLLRDNLLRLLQLTVLCAVLPPTSSAALDPSKTISQYIHASWNTEQGLPHNTVPAILQTRDKFLWVGTELGLGRFDGAHFVVFDRKNTPQLNSNLITALAEDHEGTLWIGTEGGGLTLYRDGKFNTVAQRFGSSNTIPALYVDRAGTVWIGTDGSGLVAFQQAKFQRYTVEQGLSDNSVFSISEDHAGHLWVGTHNGLDLLTNGRFQVYRTIDGLPDNYIRSLCADRESGLWIGTYAGGISHFRNNKFENFNTRSGLAGNSISTILQDRLGTLWIGTFGAGVSRFAGGVFTSFNSKNGLGDDEVWSLHQDSDGSLWVGTSQSGLHRLGAAMLTTWDQSQGLAAAITLAVMQDSSGSILAGTLHGGLNRLKDGRFTSVANGLSDDVVFSLAEGPRGQLWAGTRKGLNLIEAGKVTRFTNANGLASGSILALLAARDGSIWAGGRAGLSRYANGKFTSFTTGNGLSNNHVITMVEGSHSDLWIGTEGGLNRLHNGRFTVYGAPAGLSNAAVMAILEEPGGSLWIGTNGGGLNRFKDGRIASISSRQGLPDDAIFGILDDGAGSLWMSGNQGIFRVSKSQLMDFFEGRIKAITAVTYGKADGMKSKECNGGFSPAAWKAANGDLWFPTTRGLVAVNAKALRSAAPSLPVFIDSANLNGTPADPRTALSIPPSRGDFEFHYTAIDFASPSKLLFRYKLEGFDHDWVEAGSRRTAYYTNVPPGAYHFSVIASRGDGVWTGKPVTVSITLQPHFYETKWFKSFGVLLFFAAIITAHFKHVSDLDRRERQLAQRVEESTRELRVEIAERQRVEINLLEAKDAAEQASRVKSEFLANMSHEIRTPMHGVLGMTELALGTQLDPEQFEYLTLARSSARSLLTIINDILDFSKIEAGKLELDPLDFQVRQVLYECVKSVAFKAHEKGLEILCDFDPGIPEFLHGDPLRLRQVLLNIIGNAIKFTANGEIVLHAKMESRQGNRIPIHFIVSDTGVGIPIEKQKSVFDEFSQADTSTTRKYGGTGLGLAISARLSHMMGGRIWVESEIGKGSRFHFPLLFDESEKTAEHMPRSYPELAGKKVLVVDDNPTCLRILGDALKSWGMLPVLADDGPAALKHAIDACNRNDSFSLLLTDAGMPGVDGFRMMEALREIHHLPATIMMLNSGGRDGDVASAQQIPLAATLTKPVALDDLHTAIFRVLSTAGGPRLHYSGAPVPVIEKTVAEQCLRILLAEDNPVNQKLAVRLLEKRGHSVEIARSGLQALARLEHETFDLMLTDIQMPEMDGFEMVTALRAREKLSGSRLPVIAMTALAMKGDRERCLATGMDGYVSKPMQANELFEAIEKFCPITHT